VPLLPSSITDDNPERDSRSYIRKAKRELRIAYGHTSHGSQIITGMSGLVIQRRLTRTTIPGPTAPCIRHTVRPCSRPRQSDRTAWRLHEAISSLTR
jgi:hypothetical protein